MPYRDRVVTVDDTGLTIGAHRTTGRARRVPFHEIQDVRLIRLGALTGRNRLVGISPGRPRTYFHWDRHRRNQDLPGSKLDIGRWVRIGLTPARPSTTVLRADPEPTSTRTEWGTAHEPDARRAPQRQRPCEQRTAGSRQLHRRMAPRSTGPLPHPSDGRSTHVSTRALRQLGQFSGHHGPVGVGQVHPAALSGAGSNR